MTDPIRANVLAGAPALATGKASARPAAARVIVSAGMAAVVLGGVAGVLMLAVPSLHHLYAEQSLSDAFRAPFSKGHLLGTDNLGRDLLFRCIAGLGVSLLVGAGVSLVSLLIGLFFGITAGFFGSAADLGRVSQFS